MSDKSIVINGKEYRDFMVGADPEIRFKGIRARDVVQFEGKFGTDGPGSAIGELRPDPKYCPINLAYEIESVLRSGYKAHKRLQGVDWLGGSYPEGNAIGGHIHFDAKHNDPTFTIILDALDKLLAPVVLMLENQESANNRRNGTGYGKLALDARGKTNGDGRGYEVKGYGGFEYRSPASWIVSRQITTGVLCLGKVIAFECYNMKHNRHLERQLKCIERNDNFINSYMSANKKYFNPIIPTIHRIISTFALFPRYEKYINVLFQLVYQNRDWNETMDLKKRWQIIPVSLKKEEIAVKEVKQLSINEVWTIGLNPALDMGEINAPERELVATVNDRILF